MAWEIIRWIQKKGWMGCGAGVCGQGVGGGGGLAQVTYANVLHFVWDRACVKYINEICLDFTMSNTCVSRGMCTS